MLGGRLQFSKLAEFYEKLEGVSSRLKMMEILSEVFKHAGTDEVSCAIYITQGILLPPFEGLEFGVAEKIMEEAIALATGYTKEEIAAEFRKSGDLGLAAQKIIGSTRLKPIANNSYTVKQVYEMMLAIARTGGSGSKERKIGLLARLVSSSSPIEARYMVRYPLGALRMGVGDSTILEALSIAYTSSRKAKPGLERAYNLCCDLGAVGETLAREGMEGIERFRVSLFKPIRPALAERLSTPEQIMERMGGRAAAEHKYDGFRIQVHKKGDRIALYSRRLENITEMFPDITGAVLDEVGAESVIFEGEALAFNASTEEFLPFQETIQRKRKHGIAEKAEELPLHLFAFDVLYLDGKDSLGEPYLERRKKLERIFKKKRFAEPSHMELVDSPEKLEKFFEASVTSGLEGIIAKDLNAPYVAGARKFSWVKYKRSMQGKLSDTLDLVIVGYFMGRGQRAEFGFGGLLCAVYNKSKDVFETISRIGTGFKEAQMTELESKLSKIKLEKKPARVESEIEPTFWTQPKYVVTINADEITRSPIHTCGRSERGSGNVGYALRFPRLVGEETIRSDKSPEDATTTKEVIEMFGQQRKVGIKE
jgi:DNA ligase-1